MIDTVKVVGFSSFARVTNGMHLGNVREGSPPHFGISVADGALYVTLQPHSQMVAVRISVPRWVGHQRLNWPLQPLPTGVDDLRLPDLAFEVAHAVGCDAGGEALELFPLPAYAVTTVAVATDLSVPDPAAVIRLCLSLRRRNGGTLRTWGGRGQRIGTLQWGGRERHLQIYSKAMSLDEQGEIEAAERARTTLRVEATFGSSQAVRSAFLPSGTTGSLPSLATLCHPLVLQDILRREFRRLRVLDDVADGLDADSDGVPNRVRRLASLLNQAREDLRSGRRERVGRLRSLTPQRSLRYVAVYALASAGFSQRDISESCGWSARTTSEIVSDLHALGCPPDDGYSGRLVDVLRELQSAIPSSLQMPPSDLGDLNLGGWPRQVPSPWEDGADLYDRARLAGEASIEADRALGDPDSDSFPMGDG